MTDKPADGVRTAEGREQVAAIRRDWTTQRSEDARIERVRRLEAAAYSQALDDVAEKVERLTTWPRVSWFAYDAQVRGVPVNPTEDRVVLDRAEVLAAIEALRSRRPPADAGEGTA